MADIRADNSDAATTQVACADWLAVGAIAAPMCVDFLYADPPFNTGTTQRTPPNAKKLGRTADASYDDAVGTPRDFIAWLRPRLIASIPLLKPTALICIHVDWRTSHHVRLLLDDLFGADRFVNHLIWSYGLGGSSPRRFARKHDDLLLYCLNPETYWFDPPRVPATSNKMRGQTKKATDVLKMEPEQSETGRIRPEHSSPTSDNESRSPDSKSRGTQIPGSENQDTNSDLLDIPSINNMASERTGYPTQKPLALLDMLIRACCPPGGTVLDPCCGSGTTLVAAAMAGRNAIGLDISADAVRVARERVAVLQS